MKTILVLFLYIASSQCGVLKDDLKESDTPTMVECRRFESKLMIVKDYFDIGNITLLTDVYIDVTKDKETQSTNTENDNLKLSPGIHKWEVIFLRSADPIEEINRVLSIVEATANKTGQLIGKNCATGVTDVICHFNINIKATKPPVPKIHKREVKEINKTQSTDIDEINRLISLAEAAENKNGESDGKKCKTVDDVIICNVYLPEDSPKINT